MTKRARQRPMRKIERKGLRPLPPQEVITPTITVADAIALVEVAMLTRTSLEKLRHQFVQGISHEIALAVAIRNSLSSEKIAHHVDTYDDR